MYIYLSTSVGGFNDILCTIYNLLIHCVKYKRILLLNGINSIYKTNYADYFKLNNDIIISDTNKIIEICKSTDSIYPHCFKDKMMSVLNDEIKTTYKGKKIKQYDNNLLCPPDRNREETIIVCYINYGGAFGYKIFRQIEFMPDVKSLCKARYDLIAKPYLCIQIRNTDHKCDYVNLYNKNKDMIHSYSNIFIATDDKHVLGFFKDQGLTIKNFTTFPETNMQLHYSDVNPRDKMLDLLCDIYLISMSEKLLSSSQGSFIRLVTDCYNRKDAIKAQFE